MTDLRTQIHRSLTTQAAVQKLLGGSSGLRRIAMVSTHGYVAAQPPLGATDTGGQVVYVLELSKMLAQLGYEVDIWTRRFEDQPEIESVADHVRIVRMPCGGKSFIPKERLYEFLPEWSENAFRFISRHGLHYRFINSHYWDAGVAAQILCESVRVPHIHTPHSLGIWKRLEMQKDFHGDEAAMDEQYNFPVRIHRERLLYEAADAIVPTTLPQLERIVNDYGVPREKCHVLPPGFDDSRFFPVSASSRRGLRARLGFQAPTVMAVGRLALNKGYDLLIRAFEMVVQRVPDARLHLAVGGAATKAGENPLLDELISLTQRLKLTSNVDFGKFIPDDELANYYRAADAFVLSSRYEPFGMTALEAMACGTPTTVTSNGGFCPTITFGREALYADPFDREDLGIMMVKVLTDSRLRSRLSRLGAKKAQLSFTWRSIAERLVCLIDRERSYTASAGLFEGSLN